MNRRNNQNLIFVICGPSGVGKTSIKTALLATYHNLKICPSVTTRPVNQSASTNIQEYHHINSDEYHRLYKLGGLISKRVQQFGFYYGLKFGEIDDILNEGHHVLLETTLWGIGQLKKYFNNVISIFIAPPSLEELELRLKRRGRDSDQQIVLRLDLARRILADFEEDMVDYYLVNKNLADSIHIIQSIVSEEMLKLSD